MQTIEIQKFRRQAEEKTLRVRFCTGEDLPAILAMQAEIIEQLTDTDIFVPTTETEWITALAQPCSVVGLWDGRRLAAYGSYYLLGNDLENYAWKANVPKAEVPFWANMDTIAVSQDYRGNGLEFWLLTTMERLCPADVKGFCCTVSPDNPHSLHNVKRAGYEMVCRLPMYGGYDRYLLKKQRQSKTEESSCTADRNIVR